MAYTYCMPVACLRQHHSIGEIILKLASLAECTVAERASGNDYHMLTLLTWISSCMSCIHLLAGSCTSQCHQSQAACDGIESSCAV